MAKSFEGWAIAQPFLFHLLFTTPIIPKNEKEDKLQVLVRDNNVDQALRVLKKKMQKEGILRELKARRAYEKPSERRVREKADAISRARKAAKKQAQRDGLLPKPKRKSPMQRPRFNSPQTSSASGTSSE